MTRMFLTAIGEVPTQNGRARRGVVLVIVLSILLIMAMMGVVFVTFQSLEKRVAINFTDDVRAKMLAQSGLDHAVAELSRAAGTSGLFAADSASGVVKYSLDYPWIYYGSETNENFAPVADTPLTMAANPSYAIELDGDPANGPNFAAPRTAVVNGVTRGFSGSTQTGTYASNGDVYALKIMDESGKINVNDGVQWGPTHSVSKNLERMLNLLGNKLTPPKPTLGTTLVTARPMTDLDGDDWADGYAGKLDVLNALGGDTVLYEQIRPFITVDTWTDFAVANPVPLSAAATVLSAYPITYYRPTASNGVTVYRHGHTVDVAGRNYNDLMGATTRLVWWGAGAGPYDHGIYGHDSLNPNWIEIVGRAPVNVNTAPREVLEVLLSNLEGFFSSIERRRARPATKTSGTNYYWLESFATNSPSTAAPLASTNYGGWNLSGSSFVQGDDGDEAGFLYRTMKYVESAGAPGSGQISVDNIVDEIIACRGRGDGPVSGTDYDLAPFGGVFRSWAQFNGFVDNLVKTGVIYENRGAAYFFDYYGTGGAKAAVSSVQQYLAAQAAADVLKANFNPNLHLNELNPDRNLYQHVDKTDLIVNSTEFCFLPMNGAFEIEALGTVLKPDAGADIFASNNQIVAEKSVVALIRLHDAIRQTSQSHFYGPVGDFSTFGPKSGGATNNNFGVEVGPEPDQGSITAPAAPSTTAALELIKQHNYSGYVALSTMGGSYHGAGGSKARNSWRSNLPGEYGLPGNVNLSSTVDQWWEKMHAHWDIDHNLHFSRESALISGAPEWPRWAVGTPYGFGYLNFITEVGQYAWRLDSGFGGRITGFTNFEEPTEDPSLTKRLPGPYSPVSFKHYSMVGITPSAGWAKAPDNYKNGRGFMLPPAGTSYTFPSPKAYTPSDLRIDGLYIERGSTPAFQISDVEAAKQSNAPSFITSSSFRWNEGVVAFWMKPNWFPEATGKPRVLFTVDRARYHTEVRQQTTGMFINIYLEAGFSHSSGENSCNSPWDRGWGTGGGQGASSRAFTPAPFTLFYLPSHWTDAGSAASNDTGYPDYVNGRLRPNSFGFGTGGGDSGGLDWDIQVWMYSSTSVTTPAVTPYPNPNPHPKPWYQNNGFGTYIANQGYWINQHGYCATPPLNHEGHGVNNYDPLRGDEAGGPLNRLRAHEWTHVIATWDMPPKAGQPGAGGPGDMKVYVNNELFSQGFSESGGGYSDTGNPRTRDPVWFLEDILLGVPADFGWPTDTAYTANTLRLGGSGDAKSITAGSDLNGDGQADLWGVANTNATNYNAFTDPSPRNWSADSTFDEFYEWTSIATPVAGLSAAQTNLWTAGRYYPVASAGGYNIVTTDGTFTSTNLNVAVDPLNPFWPTLKSGGGATGSARILAAATSASAPPPDSEGGGGGTGTSLSTSAAAGSVRLLGISWTAFAEAYNPSTLPAGYGAAFFEVMVPYMRSWANPSTPTNMPLDLSGDANGFAAPSVVDMWIRRNADTPLGPYRNDGFSLIRDTSGNPVTIATADVLRYLFKFRVSNGSVANPVLLATPVLDDVTILYTNGPARFTIYYMKTTS